MSEQKVKVVVFDLNGTLYNKSSKDEFFKFVCRKNPEKAAAYFNMAKYKLLMMLRMINQTEFKENFFHYLDSLPPQKVKAYAEEFWQQEYPKNFNKELLNRIESLKKEGAMTFCATGALEVYLTPLFQFYNVSGFAGTRVKYHDQEYKIDGEACKGEEKLNRLRAFMNGRPYKIIEAYSDSKEEILDAAQKAFLIKNKKLTVYK